MSIKGGLITDSKARKASVYAVVTRADGTVENRGLISYYHRNPLLRWPVNLWLSVKKLFKTR